MELEMILSFLTASVVLSIMPGPDNIFVLTESVGSGQRTGLAISLGLSLGVLVHTLAAALGLSIIIQQSALVFSVIKYMGAAYLFYLAISALRSKGDGNLNESIKQKVPMDAFKLVRKGFLMNVLNPKVSLFFIAFLPQFISKSGIAISVQMIVLGIIFMIQALIVFSLIAILSGRLNRYLNSQEFWKITQWSKFGVLSVLASLLLLSEK
ncbi:LysE family translocator [Marinifilum sp. D737]|uniref:LysE family translocator n=1 Tax=Marinifilum sp. D737 TaxID=2969628 RepID=UPI0022736E02|nr:LysE family translocator [Marinifilum sp. D737]MCY1633201.1 LysE family translocator [Marinifilum sp. D737]